MGESKQISAKVDEDSTLYKEFVKFEEERGYQSRSEAVRALMRESLDPGKDTESQTQKQIEPSDLRPVSKKEGWEAIFKQSMDYFMKTSTLFAVAFSMFFADSMGFLPTPSVVAETFVVGAFFLFVPTLLMTAASWVALQTQEFSDDLEGAVTESTGSVER